MQSTKAADNSKLFTSSGRYGICFIYLDFKQLFENRNESHHHSNSNHQRNSSRNQQPPSRLDLTSDAQITKIYESASNNKKLEDTTIKFNR